MISLNRDYRLPPGEYYPTVQRKRHVYLHHTVGGSFLSTWDYWNSDRDQTTGERRKVGTAFIVDTDGTVYEIFDPGCWAHHLGCRLPGNLAANQESIGIELVSEGGLLKGPDGLLYWLDGKVRYKSRAGATPPVDLGTPWRGFQYFDAYDEAQVSSACQLVVELCASYGISRRLLLGPGHFNDYRPDLLTLPDSGVLTHCNVRADKTDVHPGFPWEKLERALQG